MKSLHTLRWLVTLTGEKLIRALLLIGILTIFTMFISSQNDLKKTKTQLYQQQELRRQEIVRRTDSFNFVLQSVKSDCNAKYERYLEIQLEKIDKATKMVDKTINKNAKYIKRIQNVK